VVGRGFDPRDFTIFSFGGSGAIHAAGYARELGISEVLVPGEIASVWSAFGIALSDIRHTLEGDVQLVSPIDSGELTRVYGGLEEDLLRQFGGGNGSRPELRRFARMRYEGQRNELEVTVPTGDLDDEKLAAVTADFEERYEQRYGSAALLPESRFEVVNVRSEASVPTGIDVEAHPPSGEGDAQKGSRLVAFERGAEPGATPVYDGTAVAAGAAISGPAVIDLPTTGIVVPPDATVTRTERGDFKLTFER
jgi:N-methylhydantoinase A